MSIFKNTPGRAIARVIFTFILVMPFIACQASAAKGQTADQTAAADKAAAEEAVKKAKNEADQKAAAEEAAKTLVVTGVDPYAAEKGTPGDLTKLGRAGMRDSISVIVPGLWFPTKHKVIDPNKYVLFVDGRVFKDVRPTAVGYDNVVFKLERTNEAMDAWNSLLGRPTLKDVKPVVISVGYPDQEPLKTYDKEKTPASLNQPNLNLIVYRWKWALIALVGLIITLILFYKYGTTSLLRDSRPPNPEEGKLRPYSLAKVQAAWWFFIVIGCFLLIYLITGEYTMTEQALILIGIGTGTALGASMIDSSKSSSADNELGTLRPQEAKLKAELDLLDQQITDTQNAIAANAAITDSEQAALQTDRDSLAAKTIERAEKSERLEALRLQIAEARAGLQKPTSTGFWDDLVTDADGPSFHRFQRIVWTGILGVLFLAAVYRSLAMPEFNGTMLALMGISAGTYLGFKVPEKQTRAEEGAATETTNAASETNAAADVDELDGHAAAYAGTPDEDLPITEGGVQ